MCVGSSACCLHLQIHTFEFGIGVRITTCNVYAPHNRLAMERCGIASPS